VAFTIVGDTNDSPETGNHAGVTIDREAPDAMSREPEPQAFLPLTNLAFHVLLALGDGAAHGYAIGKEVEARSGGMLNPATGSLYQVLKRLSQDSLIEQAPDADDADSRRQSFRLTALGRRVAEAEARRLDALVTVARHKRLLSR